MTVNISTENYDIINSGSVVLHMGEYIEFQIQNLKFRVLFIDECPTEGAMLESRITAGVEGQGADAYYKIILYNQHKAFFSSMPNFMDVATLEGKPLRLKFCILPINNRENSSDKIVFYSWYLGKEASMQTTNNVPQQ